MRAREEAVRMNKEVANAPLEAVGSRRVYLMCPFPSPYLPLVDVCE